METNWYVKVNEQTYGPYTWEQMLDMKKTNNINAFSIIYHEEIGDWVKANTIKELGFEVAVQNNGQQATRPQATGQQATRPQVAKKKGCLKGCLITLGIFIILIVVIIVLLAGAKNKEEMMDLSKIEVVANEIIGKNGGSIIVDDTNSEIDGFTIEVPEGAYDNTMEFEVSTRKIKEHNYGEYFNPVLPVIHIDNGGEFSNEYMMVTIPVDIPDDEFAMALYYNEDGTLEPIPMLSHNDGEMILGVRHFSELVVTSLKKALLEEYIGTVDINSGYKPMVDNWSFTNYGSEAATGGACAGMSLSSIHYYLYYKSQGEPSLYGLFDNNHGPATPSFWKDDSMGIRLVGTVQKNIDWKRFDVLCDAVYHKAKIISDKTIYYHFAYAFLLSDGAPQPVGLFNRTTVNNKVSLKAGHVIVAYAIDKTGIYVCDPNYPTKTDLKIPFDGTKFGTYGTASIAGGTVIPYNSFGLMGTTSLFSKEKMHELFTQLEDEPLNSEIGDNDYSNPYAYIWVPDEGEIRLESDIATVNLDPEDMLNYKSMALEYLELNGFIDSVEDDSMLPDWNEKPYVIVEIRRGDSFRNKSKFEQFMNNGTTPVYTSEFNKENIRYIFLEEGMTILSFALYRDRVIGYDDNDNPIRDFTYSDCIKTKLIFGEIDLSGTWEGEFQITEYDKAMNYAEEMALQIAKGITWGFSKMFGQDLTDEEIQDIAKGSIEVNEELEIPMPIKIILSEKNAQNYKALITIETDGIYEYETIASLDGDELKWSITADDGAILNFNYQVYDKSTLIGEFDIQYGTISDFVRGVSELNKKEDN